MSEFVQGLCAGMKMEEAAQMAILPNQTLQQFGVILLDIEKSWDSETKTTAGRITN